MRTLAACCVLLALALFSTQSAGQQPLFFGDPLPGISAQDFERFRIGLEDFLEVEPELTFWPPGG